MAPISLTLASLRDLGDPWADPIAARESAGVLQGGQGTVHALAGEAVEATPRALRLLGINVLPGALKPSSLLKAH
jgi:hypothetical protein